MNLRTIRIKHDVDSLVIHLTISYQEGKKW